MTSYTELDNLLTGRNRDRRKVGNNTYAERRGDDIAIRLHSTDVVTWHPDGSCTLDSGGWATVTTKDRINTWSPVDVWLKKGRWMVTNRNRGDEYPGTVPFFDGMTIGADGSLPVTDTTDEDRRNAETHKAVNRYVKGLTDQVIRGLVEHGKTDGIGGDCWFCLMQLPGDTDHLESHLEESYYMVSLCLRALEAKGYPNPSLILQVAPNLVRRAVKTYLLKALTVGAVAVR
jgi:hypothetical protein